MHFAVTVKRVYETNDDREDALMSETAISASRSEDYSLPIALANALRSQLPCRECECTAEFVRSMALEARTGIPELCDAIDDLNNAAQRIIAFWDASDIELECEVEKLRAKAQEES